MLIDTGLTRSVKGHAVSGAIFTLMAGISASKSEQGKSIVQKSIEGGIIAASSIAAANALGDRTNSSLSNLFKALGCVSVGFAGLYALNKLASKKKRKKNEKQK